jgi:hypothetical protein
VRECVSVVSTQFAPLDTPLSARRLARATLVQPGVRRARARGRGGGGRGRHGSFGSFRYLVRCCGQLPCWLTQASATAASGALAALARSGGRRRCYPVHLLLQPVRRRTHPCCPCAALSLASPDVDTSCPSHHTASSICGCRAVGAVAYELLTGKAIFPFGTTRGAVFDALAGRAALLWEASAASDAKPALRKLLRLKAPVLQARAALACDVCSWALPLCPADTDTILMGPCFVRVLVCRASSARSARSRSGRLQSMRCAYSGLLRLKVACAHAVPVARPCAAPQRGQPRSHHHRLLPGRDYQSPDIAKSQEPRRCIAPGACLLVYEKEIWESHLPLLDWGSSCEVPAVRLDRS